MSLIEVKPGEMFEARMPYSEVCMSMRVTGRRLRAMFVPPSDHSNGGVQLYELDGRYFSHPITLGEAGIYERDGKYFVEER